ncbi:hypothetical protein AVEN_255432-2-1, partial [Araneus ventricosus]
VGGVSPETRRSLWHNWWLSLNRKISTISEVTHGNNSAEPTDKRDWNEFGSVTLTRPTVNSNPVIGTQMLLQARTLGAKAIQVVLVDSLAVRNEFRCSQLTVHRLRIGFEVH